MAFARGEARAMDLAGPELVHAIFSFSLPIWSMANVRAMATVFCLCVLFSLGAGAAWADGYRFGGWRFGWRFGHGVILGGPRFYSPSFAGPRYDGPRVYEYDVDAPLPPPRGGPPPHALPPVERVGPPPPGSAPHGPRTCYSAAETRDRVAAANLREPFALMRKASAMTQGEALAGKLCRWNDQDVYEISLLRRDGTLIHVFMNAATGQVVDMH
jgi:hypothetical protein